ncbi:hypothetical protein HMPREF3024_22255 [Achromobacter xylosoxidans]|nr:hypothetical protein HMPREF3024_22255 [Achromobacter xylosoxidans]OMG78069.1 hypothetical protein BIZ53_15670 [Achromobacter xylosoxidans]
MVATLVAKISPIDLRFLQFIVQDIVIAVAPMLRTRQFGKGRILRLAYMVKLYGFPAVVERRTAVPHSFQIGLAERILPVIIDITADQHVLSIDRLWFQIRIFINIRFGVATDGVQNRVRVAAALKPVPSLIAQRR